jgi:hypothetical protein
MVTIKIKENSKQAKMFLEYAKTLSFVEFVDSGLNKPKMTAEEVAFYKKFEQAVKQSKEIASGKTKGKSLNEALDEI